MVIVERERRAQAPRSRLAIGQTCSPSCGPSGRLSFSGSDDYASPVGDQLSHVVLSDLGY
jgi:hypothetical protein